MAWMIILFFINLFISWNNAWVGGKNMREASAGGWFPWILNWSAIIMSGVGFTWCYTLALIGLGHAVGKLDYTQVDLGLKLGYVIIVPALLSTGFVITIHSWIVFFKQPSLGGGLTVAWNTYAQVSNTMNAVNFFPKAFGDVMGSMGKGSKDSKDGQAKIAMLTIMLVVLALALGVLTTRYIVLTAAGKPALPRGGDKVES